MTSALTPDDVTVIVPARNAADTIAATLRSIVDQNVGTPRVIVVDDGSSDDTATIAAVQGATVVTATGVGPGAARNVGLAAVETPLVAFCDADDAWPPDRLAHDLQAFHLDADLDVLIGRSRFDADDETLLEGHNFTSDDRTAVIPHFGAATMRRSVFERIGSIDGSLANYEDYEWFQRARDLGARVDTHERIVQTRRMHAGSTSHRNPPRPTDLLAVLQRSVARRRSAMASASRPFWFLPEFPPNPGGIGTFAGQLAPALAQLGHEMHLLVGWGGPSRDVVDGIDIVREPLRDAFERGSPTDVMRMRRKVIDLKRDVDATLYHLHISDPTPVLHLNTATTVPAPTVLTLHNEYVDRFSMTDPDGLLHRLLTTSRAITGVSGAISTQMAQARPDIAHRIITIPNGVRIVTEVPDLPNGPTLLAIGRLMPQKGFDRLVRTMPTVLDRHPDAHLDILGEGGERPALEALIEQLGLSEHVTLHGIVDRDLVPGFIARAQVVVAPSNHEGLPYALLEAAMHGRPIVAARTGGIDEVVDDGATGILVDQTVIDADDGALGRAISAVLDDPALAARWGAAGRARVEQLFSIESCARSYDQLYRNLTAAPADIAVIIPAWNGRRHLDAALDSVVAEAAIAGRTVQIVVVDDGSTDDTAAIAERYADRGVELFRQSNLGTEMARNAGLAMTNSRYIAHLDNDDLWPAGRLAALAAELDADPDLEAVFGRAVEFADTDAPAQARWNPEPTLVRTPTVGLVRRSAHDRFGAFTPTNDQMAWALQALARGLRYTTIDNVVLERRIHAGNRSHRKPFTSDRSRVSVVRAALEARRRRDQDGATGTEPPTPD